LGDRKKLTATSSSLHLFGDLAPYGGVREAFSLRRTLNLAIKANPHNMLAAIPGRTSGVKDQLMLSRPIFCPRESVPEFAKVKLIWVTRKFPKLTETLPVAPFPAFPVPVTVHPLLELPVTEFLLLPTTATAFTVCPVAVLPWMVVTLSMNKLESTLRMFRF
jgi:hypothetical protein